MSYKACYKLETLTTDYSGNGQTLTDNNTVGQSAGRYGLGADFGTSNTDKSLSRTNDLGITGGNITVSLWVKINTAPSNNVHYNLVTQGDAGTFVEYRWDYGNFAGTLKITFERLRQNVAYGDNQITQTLDVGKWYHLVGTYDGTKTSIYLDGTWKQDVTLSGNGSLNVVDHVSIGAAYNTGVRGGFANAVIDEVLIDNAPFSNQKIKTLCATQSGRIQC